MGYSQNKNNVSGREAFILLVMAAIVIGILYSCSGSNDKPITEEKPTVQKEVEVAALPNVKVANIVERAVSTIDPNETRCDLIECNAGTKVISYAKKDDPFYACSTNELATYANYVMGVASFGIQMTGHLPNISPITGEPEQEGESKVLIDKLRNEAGVSTFDEALMLCQTGKNKIRLMVMNNPKDGFQMWVGNEKTKKSFWMPKSHLNLIK